MIGALTLNAIEAAMIVEGVINGQVFETFVKECLVPILKPGDIVFLDRLRAHKTHRTKQLIEEAGATLMWLPPYSPHFNPIEECWSKVKNFLRTIAARTREDIWEAIAEALSLITEQDAGGWFGHAGVLSHN